VDVVVVILKLPVHFRCLVQMRLRPWTKIYEVTRISIDYRDNSSISDSLLRAEHTSATLQYV